MFVNNQNFRSFSDVRVRHGEISEIQIPYIKFSLIVTILRGTTYQKNSDRKYEMVYTERQSPYDVNRVFRSYSDMYFGRPRSETDKKVNVADKT